MSSLDNVPLLELDVQEWVNHEGLSNEDLRGKVVVVEVFARCRTVRPLLGVRPQLPSAPLSGPFWSG